MSGHRTYLDHNATAPLRPEARAAMIAALDLVGNASSVHAEGRRARGVVESAREHVAGLVNARPDQVVFTSGATEANVWALRGGWRCIAVAGIEHESVIETASARALETGARVVDLGVDGSGIIERNGVRAAIDAIGAACVIADHALLSLQMANGETGVIQPVAEIASLCREAGVAMHTDAVQAAGRIPIDFDRLGVDLMSLSAHKIGGPKGIGALVIRETLELPALLTGGGQERRRRAGTENVAAIAGFGEAAAAAARGLAGVCGLVALRDRLEAGVREITPAALIVGGDADRLANTSCIAVPGHQAATLLIKLDLAGIAVSAGSACSSGKIGGSHVLAALGLAEALAASAIRLSLGPTSTDGDVDRFLAAWAAIHGVAIHVAMAKRNDIMLAAPTGPASSNGGAHRAAASPELRAGE